MIVWQTAKRWKYKGRTCEIQQSSVGDASQLRGLVEVETGIEECQLDASPIADLQRKRWPMRHERGEFRTWLYFGSSESEKSALREEVNELAEFVGEREL
ncbi:hypothetical protein [Halorussus halophilus]|uniref:hypothetical protein n=1 Tax=Halorussus halophilus TaxID=2650975 RepID=UPI0013016EBF|nr:hypothetical protein [Halorussus halophilus]